MRVIWIDPGETVGWATATVTKGNGLTVLDYGNTKLKRFALSLLGTSVRYDVIGFETYRIEPTARGWKANVGSTVPTLQLIGMIRLCAWRWQAINKNATPKIVEQAPQSKTKGRGAAKLHASADIQAVINEGLAGAHDDGHYADAMLHLFAWYHDTHHHD